MQKHVLAVESVMKHLAKTFSQDEETWGLAGLLHDLDYAETKDHSESHGLLTAQWLSEKGVPQEIIETIKAHADKKIPQTLMEKSIQCADQVSGFLVACALIHPQKKLAPIDVRFAKNRLKEKRFAAGASREKIESCIRLGITLDQFLEISLSAMKEISQELGL